MWKVRELADKVTNVVMNYTETEAKVREATNDDPWGPTGSVKNELAQATFSYELFPEVLGMLWKRIIENKGNPRRIYKSLQLLHHLLLHGSDRVVRSATDRLYELRQLEDYHIVYEPGFNLSTIMPVEEYKNGELNVRVKAKELVELIQDEERLRESRKKAKNNRDKYVGISSDRMTTSRWNDNSYDDEFRTKSTYSEFDDYYNKSKTDDSDFGSSPKFESKFKSSNAETTSPSSNTKGGAPVLSMKIKESKSTKFDFGSRADENSNPVKGNEDFADFQSAFGDTGPGTENNNTSASAIDLFGDGFTAPSPVPAFAPQSQTQGNLDLFGMGINDINTGFQQLNVNTNTNNFADFQGFQGSQFQNLSGINFHSQQPQQPMSLPTPTQNSSQQMNYFSGGNTTSLLESIPDFPQSQSSNNLTFDLLQPQQTYPTVSASGQSNKQANGKAFQGTTWSDLNFSLDSLDLKNAKPKPSVQPSMNQMAAKQPNTNSSLF